MKDNVSAFHATEYDQKIRQTLPYYEDFYTQITELVKTVYGRAVSWLDVGCGTGKMGSAAYGKLPLERSMVFISVLRTLLRLPKPEQPSVWKNGNGIRWSREKSGGECAAYRTVRKRLLPDHTVREYRADETLRLYDRGGSVALQYAGRRVGDEVKSGSLKNQSTYI